MKSSGRFSVVRSTSFALAKALVDNAYEDACYDLAYSLELDLLVFPTRSALLKALLKDEFMYAMYMTLLDSRCECSRV
jgi:hypothetical protein